MDPNLAACAADSKICVPPLLASGGAASTQRPTIASSFSAKHGSLLILKVRDRCGFRPCLSQMRRTLFSLTPTASAMRRVLQWVELVGFSCLVLRMTSCTLAGVIVGLRPGAGGILLQSG